MHRDQPFSKGAKGHEDKYSVFIVALGAERPLVFAGHGDLGKKERADLKDITAEVTSRHGDLFILHGATNSSGVHGILKDPAVRGLRVSFTFRRVEHSRVQPEQQYFVGPDGRRQSLQ